MKPARGLQCTTYIHTALQQKKLCLILFISMATIITFPSGDPQGIDIGFVVDSSDAVQWNMMLNYIRKLLDYFYDEINSNIGIGIITYGDRANVAIPLNSLSGPSYNKDKILRLIGGTPQQGGSNTGFSQAMQLVPGFFSPQQGGRVGVREVNVFCLKKIGELKVLHEHKFGRRIRGGKVFYGELHGTCLGSLITSLPVVDH